MNTTAPSLDAPPALVGWAAHFQPEPQWEPPIDQRFAGAFLRIIAFLVDITLIGFLWGFVLMSAPLRSLTGSLAEFSLLIVPLLYFPLAWGRFGTTAGMRFLRLRILRSTDGSRIGYQLAVMRMVTLLVELFLLFTMVPGLLLMLPVLRDRRRQAFHDRAVGTIVVRQLR